MKNAPNIIPMEAKNYQDYDEERINSIEKILFSTHNIISHENFNDNNLEDFKYERTRVDSIQSSSSYDRDGSGQSLKVNLLREDPDVHGSRRAEVRLDSNIGKFEIGEEAWIGFSVLVPEDYQNDDSFEIIFQMHSFPDHHLGEEWRSPPLDIRIDEGEFIIHHQSDTKALTINNTPEEKFKHNLDALETGVWNDFTLHINYQLDDSGLIELYKNGQLTYSYTGAVGYNDRTGMFTKFGVYKPDWKYNPESSSTTERTLYFDAFRFAHGEASLADIDPATIYRNKTTKTEPSPIIMGRKHSLSETLSFSLNNVPEGESRLDLQVYDMDNPNELYIYINGELVPFDAIGEDKESFQTSINFDSSLLQIGENTIELLANPDFNYFIIEQLKIISATNNAQTPRDNSTRTQINSRKIF